MRVYVRACVAGAVSAAFLTWCFYAGEAIGQDAKKAVAPSVGAAGTVVGKKLELKVPGWVDDAKAASGATGSVATTPSTTTTATKPAVEASGSTFVQPTEPSTVAEAMSAAKQGLAFLTAKNWLGLSATIIFTIMFLLKTIKIGGLNIFEKYGKRLAYIIPPVLSILAALLANLAGNVSWNTVWVVLASGPVAAAANDLWKRGIMGQEHTTPMSTAGIGGSITGK